VVHEVAVYSAKPSCGFVNVFRQLNPADLSKQINEENIKVTKSDFLSALDEVKPAFGAAINTLEMCRYISLFALFSLELPFFLNGFFCGLPVKI